LDIAHKKKCPRYRKGIFSNHQIHFKSFVTASDTGGFRVYGSRMERSVLVHTQSSGIVTTSCEMKAGKGADFHKSGDNQFTRSNRDPSRCPPAYLTGRAPIGFAIMRQLILEWLQEFEEEAANRLPATQD
jgi:hypothetical protein